MGAGVDSVGLTLKNNPSTVLSLVEEWTSASFLSHQSLGRPVPGTMALYPGQLLQLEAYPAVSKVRAVCWRKAYGKGRRLAVLCWDSSLCLMAPLNSDPNDYGHKPLPFTLACEKLFHFHILNPAFCLSMIGPFHSRPSLQPLHYR